MSLHKECKSCKISFHADKVGDGASWFTTFFLCIFLVPVAYYLDRRLELSLIELAFSFTLLILILSTLLLIISKYYLISRILKLEYDEKK